MRRGSGGHGALDLGAAACRGGSGGRRRREGGDSLVDGVWQLNWDAYDEVGIWQGAGRLAVYPGYIDLENGSGHANAGDTWDIYCTTIGSEILPDAAKGTQARSGDRLKIGRDIHSNGPDI